VRELAEHFPVTRPAVSQHLRVLTEARLVSHEKRPDSSVCSSRALKMVNPPL